jgi:mono/diheme cytochrome c family protein
VRRRLRRAAGLAAAAWLAAACGDQPAPPPAAEKSVASAPTATTEKSVASAPTATTEKSGAATPAPAEKPPAASASTAPAAAVSSVKGSPEKGKQLWLGQCVACHNPDPAKDGTLGPAVKGSSPSLLEARVVRGEYPLGYTPKRPTKVMPPRPDLAPSVPDLAAYLQ